MGQGTLDFLRISSLGKWLLYISMRIGLFQQKKNMTQAL